MVNPNGTNGAEEAEEAKEVKEVKGVKGVDEAEGAEGQRRGAVSRLTRWAMLGGLVGGYGAFSWIALRFLYPARPTPRQWTYVARPRTIGAGESLLFRGPAGETINIARQGEGDEAEDFIALSSTCPHLGCQVFWEAHNDRFFCPCHNGVFDPQGRGVSGPPGDAGQSLPRYPLKVDGGLLYVEVPVASIASRSRGRIIKRVPGIHAAGHDPCLAPDSKRCGPGHA